MKKQINEKEKLSSYTGKQITFERKKEHAIINRVVKKCGRYINGHV